MADTTHSRYSIAALDFLFNNPIFNSTLFVRESKIPEPTARRILKLASEKGLLQVLQPASGRRPKIFVFPELLNAAEGRAVF